MTEAYASSNPTQLSAEWTKAPNTSRTPFNGLEEEQKPTPKRLFQYAAENLESSYQLSRDIQEKYGIS
jgi:hypothetical protein